MRDDGKCALVTDGLTKRYGRRKVLSDVSVRVAPEERVALLGHNGAGKSTLVRLVLGLLRATAGQISVNGHRPGSGAARRATAYLPEQVAFHPALTCREQLTTFARLAGEPSSTVMPLLERVGLAGVADARVGTYSKGMRQRLGLAQTLLGRRRVVLLDEPTSGLDPVSRHDVYAVIDEMAANGTAILVASHALTELEARTDRIAILRQGRLVADDSLKALSRSADLPTRIHLTARTGAAERVQAALGGTRVNGTALELHCPADEKKARLARIAEMGDAVSDVGMTPPSLEDLYRHYCGEDLR